jgi:aspartate aminotransferase
VHERCIGRDVTRSSPCFAVSNLAVFVPEGAFYVFPSVTAFMGRKAPDGRVIQDDTALARYLLEIGNDACVQGAAFGSSPYLRFSFALAETALTGAISQIRDALGALAR